MNVEVAGRVLSTLPVDDDHPYRTGAWRPNFVEYDASDLDVVGEIPDDLDGVYLRNTENPVHPSTRSAVSPVRRRRHAPHAPLPRRPRRVPQPLRPHRRLRGRASGGSRAVERHPRRTRAVAPPRRLGCAHADEGRVEHRRRRARRARAHVVLPMRRPVRARPAARSSRSGARPGTASFPSDWGISAHQKPDPNTGEMLVFNYAKTAPYHALRRGRRRQRARALGRRSAPRPAPSARHGVHRALRDPQRLPAVLGRRSPRQGRPRPALPPRSADPFRGDPASGRRPPTSAGSRRSPRTSCTGRTRTRTATTSCSTGSSRATRCRRGRRGTDRVPARVPRHRHAPDADDA